MLIASSKRIGEPEQKSISSNNTGVVCRQNMPAFAIAILYKRHLYRYHVVPQRLSDYKEQFTVKAESREVIITASRKPRYNSTTDTQEWKFVYDENETKRRSLMQRIIAAIEKQLEQQKL